MSEDRALAVIRRALSGLARWGSLEAYRWRIKTVNVLAAHAVEPAEPKMLELGVGNPVVGPAYWPDGTPPLRIPFDLGARLEALRGFSEPRDLVAAILPYIRQPRDWERGVMRECEGGAQRYGYIFKNVEGDPIAFAYTDVEQRAARWYEVGWTGQEFCIDGRLTLEEGEIGFLPYVCIIDKCFYVDEVALGDDACPLRLHAWTPEWGEGNIKTCCFDPLLGEVRCP